MYIQHPSWAWLTALLLALYAASSDASPASDVFPHHPQEKEFIRERYGISKPEGMYRARVSGAAYNDFTAAGHGAQEDQDAALYKKVDAQNSTLKDLAPVSLIPHISSLPAPPPVVSGLATSALALVGAPSSTLTSTPIASPTASPAPRLTENGHSESSTAQQTAPPSSHSSLPFSPALLAFILVFTCLFLLVMFVALRRIYGRKRSRFSPASPLFLDNARGIGSAHHRRDIIELTDPWMKDIDMVLKHDRLYDQRFDPSRSRTQSIDRDRRADPFRDVSHSERWESSDRTKMGSMSEARSFSGTYEDTPISPLPVYVTNTIHPSARRSRVVRPYHRPHPAYTTDPESVMPLVASNAGDRGGSTKSKVQIGGHRSTKGKENVTPFKDPSRGRRRRDTLYAAPLSRSAHSLASVHPQDPVFPSDVPIDTEAETQSASSAVETVRDSLIPPLPSTITAVDIGLAMLREFSSPQVQVGLGLDLHSDSKGITKQEERQQHHGDQAAYTQSVDLGAAPGVMIIPHPASDLAPASSDTVDTSGDGTLAYLVQSTSSGNKGLAYLTSGSSERLMTPEERDITEHASGGVPAPAVEGTTDSGARVRFLGHGLLASPDAQYVSGDARAFKAPTLPTLSEMALSRADPLYESVTNELFASYGVRMSTASGAGRMSRVSARISRMLSWFGEAGDDDGTSDIGDRMSMSSAGNGLSPAGVDRTSTVVAGGVQPLRIGKLRRSME